MSEDKPTNQAGKGDKPRPVDKKTYDSHYQQIDRDNWREKWRKFCEGEK